MEHYGKEHNMYHGIIIPFVFMIIIIPVILYFLFYFAVGSFKQYDHDSLVWLSLFFAFLLTSLFDLSCILSGFINGMFTAFIQRVRTLCRDYKIFKGNAVKWYFRDFLEKGGPILWPFLLITTATIVFTVISFVTFLRVYY